jgi:diacylglycerol kinase family enzyme
MKGVAVLRADCVSLSDPQDRCVYVQIDGEFAGRLPAEIRIVPDALTLLTPPEYGG